MKVNVFGAGAVKLICAFVASTLLILFCWFFLIVGSVQAFSGKMPMLTPTATTSTARLSPQVIVVKMPATTQSNTQDNSIPTVLIALLSGSVGAIIGGVTQAKMSNKGLMKATERQAQSLFQATEQQIKSLYAQEKEKRDYEEQQQVKVLKHAIQAEVQENINLATQWQTDYSKSILTTEAWAIYKGHISMLPPTLQEKLIHAYAEIKRYNSLVEYDRLRVNASEGTMDNSIKIEAKKVVDICRLVMDELSQS